MKSSKPPMHVLVLALAIMTTSWFVVWVANNYKLVPKVEIEA